MYLTTVLDPISIFPIRFQYTSGSVYVANVTANTTGEVVLEKFQACVGEHKPCKLIYLIYHGKDIQLIDTLERIRIKVNVKHL